MQTSVQGTAICDNVTYGIFVSTNYTAVEQANEQKNKQLIYIVPKNQNNEQ